jgi:hypothetical protein
LPNTKEIESKWLLQSASAKARVDPHKERRGEWILAGDRTQPKQPATVTLLRARVSKRGFALHHNKGIVVGAGGRVRRALTLPPAA